MLLYEDEERNLTGYYMDHGGRLNVKTSMQPLSDEGIIRAIAGSNSVALSELYERYAILLMSVGFRILKNRADTEDLVHDVFLEVWNKAEKYDNSRGKVKTWLVLITRSRALDRLRMLARARQHAMVAQVENDVVEQTTAVELSSDHSTVRRAMSSLSEPQRHVLQLNYFEGLSCQEISNKLNTPLGTIKARLRYAIKNLRITFNKGELNT